MVDNVGMDSKKLRFVSISTVYKDDTGVIVVTISLITTPTSRKISVKYHWFRPHVGKEVAIRKI